MSPLVHIEIDGEGTPRTINRRVKVHMIAQKHLDAGESPAEIADHYGITLSDVHAALAYYYDNRDHFDARAHEVEPLNEKARQYTADLKVRIQKRMQGKKSEG